MLNREQQFLVSSLFFSYPKTVHLHSLSTYHTFSFNFWSMFSQYLHGPVLHFTRSLDFLIVISLSTFFIFSLSLSTFLFHSPYFLTLLTSFSISFSTFWLQLLTLDSLSTFPLYFISLSPHHLSLLAFRFLTPLSSPISFYVLTLFCSIFSLDLLILIFLSISSICSFTIFTLLSLSTSLTVLLTLYSREKGFNNMMTLKITNSYYSKLFFFLGLFPFWLLNSCLSIIDPFIASKWMTITQTKAYLVMHNHF